MPKNDYLSKADLKELLNDRINPEDTSIIIGAYEMAENAEAGETDPTGAPKFYHNTRVCRILIDELSVSAPELLITALLHNILSASSEITISIIDYNFGSYVAYLVQLISDDYAERKGDKAPAIKHLQHLVKTFPKDPFAAKAQALLAKLQTPEAEAKAKMLESDPKYDDFATMMVKTHLSLSHDVTLKGVPKGWTLPIRDVLIYSGAKFLCPCAGTISLMPGTSSNPAFRRIDVDTATGEVKGLF